MRQVSLSVPLTIVFVRTLKKGGRTTDGPGGAPAPTGPTPIASALGDTDDEFSAEFFCGRKILRPNVASTTVDAEVFFF